MLVKKYLDVLECLQFEDKSFLQYKQALLKYNYEKSIEETFSWVSCVLALKAASNGNLAVGAILVRDDLIIHEACNEMLRPYFRSDGHPEMMVLSEYEINNDASPGSMKKLVMYSSLEPCPMCLTRASSTGLGMLKYVSSHPGSGMANAIDKLPVLWQIFCEDIEICESDCSFELKDLSYALLNLTAKIHIPEILIYKEGKYPENRMENYTKNLEIKDK